MGIKGLNLWLSALIFLFAAPLLTSGYAKPGGSCCLNGLPIDPTIEFPSERGGIWNNGGSPDQPSKNTRTVDPTGAAGHRTIQGAVNALGAAGGTVKVTVRSDHTYIENLVIRHPVIIEPIGENVIPFLPRISWEPGIDINPTRNAEITIRGFWFYPPYAQRNTASIVVRGGSAHIKNNQLNGTGGYAGILVTGGSAHIDQNKIVGMTVGIETSGATSKSRIEKNWIEAASEVGIKANGPGRVLVLGNLITQSGIGIFNSTDGHYSGNGIFYNGVGLELHTVAVTEDVRMPDIIANRIRGNTGAAVSAAASSFSAFRQNTITCNSQRPAIEGAGAPDISKDTNKIKRRGCNDIGLDFGLPQE
jgi:hypothetical protein